MKTHFLISESPQKFDQSIQALCGAILANPQPVVMMETGRGFPDYQSVRDCGKCYSKAAGTAFVGIVGRAYVYGIQEGEEAMHSGDTLEKLEQAVSKHSKFTQGIDSGPDGKSEIAATENR